MDVRLCPYLMNSPLTKKKRLPLMAHPQDKKKKLTSIVSFPFFWNCKFFFETKLQKIIRSTLFCACISVWLRFRNTIEVETGLRKRSYHVFCLRWGLHWVKDCESATCFVLNQSLLYHLSLSHCHWSSSLPVSSKNLKIHSNI